jgi:hypothetical protein
LISKSQSITRPFKTLDSKSKTFQDIKKSHEILRLFNAPYLALISSPIIVTSHLIFEEFNQFRKFIVQALILTFHVISELANHGIIRLFHVIFKLPQIFKATGIPEDSIILFQLILKSQTTVDVLKNCHQFKFKSELIKLTSHEII